MRRSWRRASARLRIATGVAGPAALSGRRVEHKTPWLGLALWGFACAGLLVSLIMERGEAYREQRLAAHPPTPIELPSLSRPGDGGELPAPFPTE